MKDVIQPIAQGVNLSLPGGEQVGRTGVIHLFLDQLPVLARARRVLPRGPR